MWKIVDIWANSSLEGPRLEKMIDTISAFELVDTNFIPVYLGLVDWLTLSELEAIKVKCKKIIDNADSTEFKALITEIQNKCVTYLRNYA